MPDVAVMSTLIDVLLFILTTLASEVLGAVDEKKPALRLNDAVIEPDEDVDDL